MRNYKLLMYILENIGIKNLYTVKIPYNYGKERCKFYCLIIEQNSKNPYVLISAGMHGNENGGIYGLLDFLPRLYQLQNKYNFLIFPVVNIWGYIREVRSFENRIDLNRGFWNDGLCSVHKNIMVAIKKYKPKLAIDIHTDSDSKSFSVFETFVDNSYIFDFPEMSEITTIEKDGIIDKQTCKDGIIYSRKEEATLESYAYRSGAKLSITVELPGRLPIFDQIKIGSTFLDLLFKKIDPKKFI